MRESFIRGIRRMVVKVGTSVLTSRGCFDERILRRLCGQISPFLKKGVRVFIVSSGAIGAGMHLLGLKKRPQSLRELQAAAAVGQRYLMQCYERGFAREGFSTAQVLLTWEDLAHKKRLWNAKRTLEQIQRWRAIPIVNENDTVATDEIRFGDNDRLSSLLAILVEADVLVILSDTDGLYARPALAKSRYLNACKGGARIQIVEKMSASIFSHVKDRRNSFTVGGMRSKLEAIRISTSSGIPVFLANGRHSGILTRLFEGEDRGTFFVPHPREGRRAKSWIAHFRHHMEAARG